MKWLWIGWAVALWACVAGVRADDAAPAPTTRFTQALAVASDAPRFPTDAAAQIVSLPDLWARTRPELDGAVWYRIAFDAPTQAETSRLLGVLIERACTNLEVFLNGQLVHSGGRMTEPVTRNCYRPQYFTLAAPLLRERGNLLDVKVVGEPLAQVSSRQRAGALSAVEIGPAGAVAEAHRDALFRQVTLPQTVVGMLLLLGAFMMLLGAINRRDRHLLYFGFLCLAWTLFASRLWLAHSVLPDSAIEWLIASTASLVALGAAQFLLRYAGWRHRHVDRALGAQCLVMPASLLLAGPSNLFVLAGAWYVLLAAEVVAAMVWYLRLTRRRTRRDRWPMAALLAGGALLVGAEIAVQPDRWVDAQRLGLSVGLPLIFALLGARLLWQHARALREAELGQRTLESRVREATVEIERNFKLMAEMRVEQVTQAERKRIAADLHDDLGAKLLTIVHTSGDDRIATLAREALEEMRLSVRGLAGRPVRLNDALGDWRAELVSRLSQAGVESEWRAPAEDLPQVLAARAYVQTTRILREAVSNVIKHSGASRCSVAFRVADGDVQLVIQDNGKGIPMELDGKLDRGHGMSSMKQRAKQLHGQCLVESGPGYGTVIRLTLPLERQVATPA
jgi:two-component system sensor histidine kinase UhpB